MELGFPAEGQCYEFGVKKHRYPTDGTIIGHTVAKGSVPLMHE